VKTSVDNELKQVAWAGLLHASAKLIQLMDADLAARNLLSMSWYDVLLQLKRSRDGRLRLSELADKVILSRSGLTRLIDRLEAAGYLRRETAEQDRRGAYACLLPAGDKALQKTWEIYEGLILKHFGDRLSSGEARTLHEVFSRLLSGEPSISKPVALTIRRET
jgi:DNA-binding MarR family transcriptional regulator